MLLRGGLCAFDDRAKSRRKAARSALRAAVGGGTRSIRAALQIAAVGGGLRAGGGCTGVRACVGNESEGRTSRATGHTTTRLARVCVQRRKRREAWSRRVRCMRANDVFDFWRHFDAESKKARKFGTGTNPQTVPRKTP